MDPSMEVDDDEALNDNEDEPADDLTEAADGEVFDEDVDYDPVLSDDLKERIRVMLTIQASVCMSLDKINTGWEKKMRFIILEPCKTCGVANHVDIEDLPARGEFDTCEDCHNEKKFQRKVIYRIPIPIGAQHGSTVVLPNKGHVYNDHIKGNVVITLLDDPHEHFLRVFDDVIICFQIDKAESIHGVTRMFTPPGYPESSIVVIQTAPGCQVKDNDVFLVEGLGLMTQDDDGADDDDDRDVETRKRGNLFILFFVRSQHSVEPVNWKNVRLRSCANCDDTADTELVSSSTYLNLNGSPADSSHEMKQNGIRSPRKRKRNGEFEENPKANPVKSVKSARVPRYNIPQPAKIRPEDLPDKSPIDDVNLSFLDRLVNHPGAIPMAFRDPVPVEIPMTELELLWRRYRYGSWWQRVPNITKRCPDSFTSDRGAKKRRWNLANSFKGIGFRYCPNCSEDKPLFDLEDDSVNSSAEAVKELLTRRSTGYPDYPKFTLECSLYPCRVKQLLTRLKVYLTGPKAKGTS